MEAVLHSLDQPVFTLGLGDTSNAVMNLGAIDHSRYSGNLTTVDGSVCPWSWCVGDVTFSVNGKEMGFTQKRMAVGKWRLHFSKKGRPRRAIILRLEARFRRWYAHACLPFRRKDLLRPSPWSAG